MRNGIVQERRHDQLLRILSSRRASSVMSACIFAAVLVAVFKLLKEYRESTTRLLPGISKDDDRVDDMDVSRLLPLDVSILGAAGYTASLGGRGAFQALPFLDPLLASCLDRIPLLERGPNLPRVGWEASPLNHGLQHWPDSEFKKRLRLSRPVFQLMVHMLKAAGYVADNKCRNQMYLLTAEFKVAVALMHLAYGGTWWQTGFSAGISAELAEFYTKQVCQGIVDLLRPMYMPGKPTPEQAQEVQNRFK